MASHDRRLEAGQQANLDLNEDGPEIHGFGSMSDDASDTDSDGGARL